jgi:hypothetical protein
MGPRGSNLRAACSVLQQELRMYSLQIALMQTGKAQAYKGETRVIVTRRFWENRYTRGGSYTVIEFAPDGARSEHKWADIGTVEMYLGGVARFGERWTPIKKIA